MISEESKANLKKLTLKQRKAKFKAHFKKMKEKHLDLMKLIKKDQYSDKNIPGFSIKHFRGHTDKRFSTPFFRSSFDRNSHS